MVGSGGSGYDGVGSGGHEVNVNGIGDIRKVIAVVDREVPFHFHFMILSLYSLT